MALKQIDHDSKDYALMIELRYQLLRQPLGLQFSADELEKEKDDILIASFEYDKMLGCCVLSRLDAQVLRLRQMAVLKTVQGKGIGESIINFTENLARDRGYSKITMHARNTAIGFYERFGYKVCSEEYHEVGLPHHHMEKFLL